jgi:serine/threonine-protein kinase
MADADIDRAEPRDKPHPQRSRYTRLRLHAREGLSEVWVARDADLNREVALNEIRPNQAQYPGAWRYFLREPQITGQLEHPGIVPVYELARRPEDDQPFYTRRLIRGRTLREVITDYHRKRRAGEAVRLELHGLLQAFILVCQAIAYAHSRRVIHRDLKPENVLVSAFGEVIVLEWGLALIVDRRDDQAGAELLPGVSVTEEASVSAPEAGQIAGTPAYMAPEQAEGRFELIDARSDVYGLGAILFEILTGRAPHKGTNTAELLRGVIFGETPRARAALASVPPALDAVCAHAMARAKVDRYASAGELALEVQRWLADEPVSAYREGLVARLLRWSRRHYA